MGIKVKRYYAEYEEHVFSMDPKKSNEQQRLCAEIMRSGAYFLWTHLRTNIVRGTWTDHEGYPIKEKFFDSGKLACTISIRRLVKLTGFANQKIQKLIKQLIDAGWIETDNKSAKKGQTVFILGRWVHRTLGNGKKKYGEILFEREIKFGTRQAPCLKGEKVKGVEDLTELSDEAFIAKFKSLYGEEMLNNFVSP